MDKRIEEARKRAREKALDVVANGTAAQRILLIMAETDRRTNNRGKALYKPLLTIKQTQELIDRLDNDKAIIEIDRKQQHFDRIVKATSVLENAYVKLTKNYYTALYYQVHWADVEAMETAVNIALMGVENVSQRKTLADGIAKRLELVGCSQTSTPEGLLLISHHNPSLENDLAARIENLRSNLPRLLGQYKGAMQAILSFMDAVKIKMPATRGFIKDTENNLKWIFNTTDKYSDTSRQQTQINDKYRLFPLYDDVEPNKDTIKLFNNYYLLPTKDEARG